MTETESSALHAQSLRLTIRLGASDILLAVRDSRSDRRIIHETFPANRSISVAAHLRELATKSELLGSGFRSALVMLDTETMLVPLDEYPNEDMATLFHSAFSGHEGEELVTNVLPDLKAVAVFAVNKDLKSVLGEHFADLSFVPIVQPVWRHLYRRNFATPRKKLFVYFHDQRMQVFSYAQSRLRFCNCFDGRREHDALYYLLYAWHQLGYNGEDDELVLAGKLPNRDWLLERLRQYVRRCSVVNPAVDFGATSASLDHNLPYDLKVVFLGQS